MESLKVSLVYVTLLLLLLLSLFYKQFLAHGTTTTTSVNRLSSLSCEASPTTVPQLTQRIKEYSLAAACEKERVNSVLERGDKINIDFSRQRRWSIDQSTFVCEEQHHCASLAALQQSLQFGRRQTMPNDRTSTFIPSSCYPRWLHPDDTCDVLNGYNIMFLGDSLSRHHYQGILMLLSGDWVFGGLPRLGSTDLFSKCVCDGQFSEHILCRTYPTFAFTIDDPHAYGFCHWRHSFLLRNGGDDFSSLCSRDKNVVFLQGGAHYFSDSSRFINEFLHPQLQSVAKSIQKCDRNQSVVVMVSGLNSQATELDSLWPQQSRANAAIFNEKVRLFMESVGPSLPFRHYVLDFMNLTLDAPTSDGYHYLSDVNLWKALYFVNIVSAL